MATTRTSWKELNEPLIELINIIDKVIDEEDLTGEDRRRIMSLLVAINSFCEWRTSKRDDNPRKG